MLTQTYLKKNTLLFNYELENPNIKESEMVKKKNEAVRSEAD